MRPVLVKAIMASSGRYAIMARADVDSPWVQIESVLGMENADRLVDEMENDDAIRAENCRDMADEEWGADAPPASWVE